MKTKIGFKDLDWKLQLPVVIGWIFFVLFCIGVVIGAGLAVLGL